MGNLEGCINGSGRSCRYHLYLNWSLDLLSLEGMVSRGVSLEMSRVRI
jgi:hypothetical protein